MCYKWQFFSNMMFIKDQFTPRTTTGNIPDNQLVEICLSDKMESSTSKVIYDNSKRRQLPATVNEEMQLESIFTKSLSDSSEHISTPRKKKNKRNSTLHKLVQLKSEELRYYKRSSKKFQNDDYHFVMSLLPYIKQLPIHRKLHVRTKIQQLVTDEYDELHSSHESFQFISVPTPSPLNSTTLSTENSS